MYKELPIPPDDGDEILRVGIRKGCGNTMCVISLDHAPKDPGGFAIILGDLAQNYVLSAIANGITLNGVPVTKEHVMKRILEVFVSEMMMPTDTVRQKQYHDA